MELREFIVSHFNFWIYVILMMIGLYAMITKNNLIKKLIGMSIFQTAIILFFVSLGVKITGGIPILEHHGSHGEEHHVAESHYAAEGKITADDAHPEEAHEGGEAAHSEEESTEVAAAKAEGETEPNQYGETAKGGEHHEGINPDEYANPLPHVLMLTAIVVGVATLGVALAITQFIYREYGTLEEKEILEKIRSASTHG